MESGETISLMNRPNAMEVQEMHDDRIGKVAEKCSRWKRCTSENGSIGMMLMLGRRCYSNSVLTVAITPLSVGLKVV